MGLLDFNPFGALPQDDGQPNKLPLGLLSQLFQNQPPQGILGGPPQPPEGRSVAAPDFTAGMPGKSDSDYAQSASAPMQLPSANGGAPSGGFDIGGFLDRLKNSGFGDNAIAFGAGLMSKRGGAGVQQGLENVQRQTLIGAQTDQLKAKAALQQQELAQKGLGQNATLQYLIGKGKDAEQAKAAVLAAAGGNSKLLEDMLKNDDAKPHWFTGVDGKTYAADPNDPSKPAVLVPGQPSGGGHWAQPGELPAGTDTRQPVWISPDGQPKGIAGATSISVDTGTKAREAGMKTAYELDAQAVRKAQNEQLPALDDADHNMAIMRTAIDRNGGKLPTGGALANMGLDFARMQSYLRDNFGINVGNPDELANLEAFNKGGIRLAGDNAKAVGGNRVLKTEFDLSQRAVPGIETSNFGNVYNLDAMQNTNNIKRDYLQAQEDFWRKNDGSLTGFNQAWKREIEANPRYLSSYSVVKPVDTGDGSQMVKLPSTAQGGYTWFRKGQDGSFTPVTDKQTAQILDRQSPMPSVGGKAESVDQTLARARDAIARGASRQDVVNHLLRNGINPAGL